jgi:DNA-binding IclR family transcriptional regulator
VSQSVARALRILLRLGQGPAGLEELANALGVHKSTVLRLLRTLAEERFVVRDGSHLFRLGPRVIELSSRALDQREVRLVAASHLAAFNRDHGRTTHLAVLEGDEALYVDKLESRDKIQMYSRIGLTAPLHCSAVGKVLLADLPETERDAVVSRLAMTATTANTITDRDALRAELQTVRRQGWAQDREENERSINCVAAPVRDASGRAVAAVSVSVPTVVLDYEGLLDLVPGLVEVTNAISADLGWQPDPTP